MAEALTDLVPCSRCAFWEQDDDKNGFCRRHGPLPSENMDEIAHWPLTRGHQSCGEGILASNPRPPRLRCDACIYWRQVGDGIDPMLRRDQRSDWWHHAAHCIRFPPIPSREPGPRAYWRATNAADGCFDGKPR